MSKIIVPDTPEAREAARRLKRMGRYERARRLLHPEQFEQENPTWHPESGKPLGKRSR